MRPPGARIESERELLGGLRMLLAPEGEEGLGVDGPTDRAQPVDTRMAAAAEADEKRQARDAGPAMVHDQRRRGQTGLRAHPTEAAIAADDRRPVAAIAAPVMLLARVAGRAEAALMQFVGARILIIDEVHALLAGSYRQQRILLNTLRFLATDLRIPLVCAGTADAKRALTTDQQLADRFEAIELPRWHNDEAFHRLLSSFQSILPLRQRSDLVSPAMRRLLLERTDGVTVRLVRLIETLAVEAIRSGSERIDQNSLLNMTNSPLLSMAEDAGVPV